MKSKPIRLGVIGCGTVGSSFIKALKKNKKKLRDRTGIDFIITAACDKNRKRASCCPDVFTADENIILNSPDIDIVVELTGGVDYPFYVLQKAFESGKSVVTANKALISEKAREIFQLAEKKDVHIGFEASVAGAVPIIKAIRESFIGNRISRIYGILNGTTNYILSRMTLNASTFPQALSRAQKLGYAEADPFLDIAGHDTAHKISILSALAFNKPVYWKNLYIEGIEKTSPMDIAFTKEFGYRIKLLAIAQKKGNKLDIRVHPTLLPEKHPLSSVESVYNAVYIEGDMAGKALFYGEGAGGSAAASAVIGDVVDIGKKLAYNNTPMKSSFYEDKKISTVPIKEISSKYYFRFTCLDKPGVLAGIANILGKKGISIDSVIQKQKSPEKAVPTVMLTHTAKEEDVQKAVRLIDKLPLIKKNTVVLRVEG